MSYAQDTGYTPPTFSDLVSLFRQGVNAQFSTTYTVENFVASNWYKYFYQAMQKVLENETKTAEIFAKLQNFIATTNLRIQRPSVSLPGIIDSFTANGWVASVKKNLTADAGTVSVCVNTDSGAANYAATKLAICTFLKDFVAAGMIFEGTEVQSLTLSNGQSFDFKFSLPNKIPVLLRLTLTSSKNQEYVIPTDEIIRQAVFDKTNANYRLGWDFEPERYYTQADAPWASVILLEWSSNAGTTYHSTVYTAAFQDLFTFNLSNIAVIVDGV